MGAQGRLGALPADTLGSRRCESLTGSPEIGPAAGISRSPTSLTPSPARRDGSVVGIDRGVVVSAALSTGELLHAPDSTGESKRLKVLQQRLARAKRGSNRRARTKLAIAKLRACERDRRQDWVEKATTDIARRFDTIRIEALDVRAMTRTARGTVEQPGELVAQKRGLNRAISRSGWACSPRVAAQGFRSV